jgi:hypothetical protein
MPTIPIPVPPYMRDIAARRQIPVEDAIHEAFGHWHRGNTSVQLPPGYRAQRSEVRMFRRDPPDTERDGKIERVVVMQAFDGDGDERLIVSLCIEGGPWRTFGRVLCNHNLDPYDAEAVIGVALDLYREADLLEKPVPINDDCVDREVHQAVESEPLSRWVRLRRPEI